MERLAPLIAVVGSDGSGKSTLAADLLDHVRQSRPAETVYLGLHSGAMGERIRRVPVVGPALERLLSRKAGKTRDPGGKIPGLTTALVIYRLSLRRKAAFKRLLALRRRGIAVVTDRYPQTEVAGFYDGPHLSAARPKSALVAWLAARERAAYEWMASFPPTLVIKLHVDLGTALARKPDHDPELIARKISATRDLGFSGAPLVELDATMPYRQELALAKAAVDEALAKAD